MDWAKLFFGKKGSKRKPTRKELIIAISVFSVLALGLVITLIVVHEYDCSIIIQDVADLCVETPWHGMHVENDRLAFFIEPIPGSFPSNSNYSVAAKMFFADNPNRTASFTTFTENQIPLHGGPTQVPGFATYLDAGRWQIDVTLTADAHVGNTTQRHVYKSQPSVFIEPVQDLTNLQIAIGTLVGSGVTGTALIAQVIFSRRQNRLMEGTLANEKKRRWDDWYEMHSKMIADDLENNWGKDSGIFAGAKYVGTELVTSIPLEPGTLYSTEAKAHLTDGYPQAWKLYADARERSLHLSAAVKTAHDNLTEEVSKKISMECNLPRRTDVDYKSRRFFEEGYIVYTVILHATSVKKYGPRDPPECVVGTAAAGKDSWSQVSLESRSVSNGNPTEASCVKDVVDRLFTDQTILKLTDIYLDAIMKQDNDPAIQAYQAEIASIVHKVRTGVGIEKERSCTICKKRYFEIFGL